MRDLYADLGVHPSATVEEIRQAYRRVQAEDHPDKNPGDKEAEERFIAATVAREVLCDPTKRAAYDQMRISSARGTLDKREFGNLLLETMTNLGPEFKALHLAAQARNWVGLAFTTGSIGLGLWSMARQALGLVRAPAPTPPQRATVKQLPTKTKAKRKK